MDLTHEDIGLLLDAIEKWEQGDSAGEIVGDMLVAMVARGDKEILAKMEADSIKRKAQKEEERRIRKERGVLLRAKLLSIRDRKDIASITREP